MTTTTRRNTRRKQETAQKEQDTASQAQESGAGSEGAGAFAAMLAAHGIGTAPVPVDMPDAQTPVFPPARLELNNAEVDNTELNNAELSSIELNNAPQNHAKQRSPRKSRSKANKAERDSANAAADGTSAGELPSEKDAVKTEDKSEEKSEAKTRERTSVERYNVTIHELPSNERPRERLTHFGASALSTTELLAISLRTGSLERSAVGVAELLLSEFGGLRGVANAGVEQLKKVKGIGEAKAVEIIAAVELGKRLSALSNEERPCIRSPQDVANLLMPEMRDLKKEHLKSLLLDSNSEQTGYVRLS